MTEAQAKHIREVRARAKIRTWQYRQRHHAHGVWYRWRRLLTDARAAYVISENDARRLIDAGLVPEPVGLELNPPKTVLFASEALILGLEQARPLPVTLGAELLTARYIALVRF